MIDVVDAIAYAHARLVVHQDITPSNVLVDTDERVKVLDFGIAKLLDTEQTQLTQAHAMTLRYASPEQLLGKPISVGSDIHQLVLLSLEILIGRTANDDACITSAIERAAGRLSLNVDSAARRSLPREVVLIIEQCLRNGPDERYRDANRLRDDLAAYINGYPVTAAGQSVRYRFRKFIGRNLPSTAIAVSAVLAIAVSTVWYTNQVTEQRNEAQRQTRLAEESLDFLADMFEASDPDNAQGRDLSAIDVLDLGAKRIGTELADQPEIQNKLYLALGKTFYRLGILDKAEEAAVDLVRVSEQLEGNNRVSKIEALNLLGNIKNAQGDDHTALAIFEDLARDAESSLGANHPNTLKVKNNLAIVYWNTGNFSGASTMHEDIYERKIAEMGQHAETTLATAVNMSQLYVTLGEVDKAMQFTRENVAFSEE